MFRRSRFSIRPNVGGGGRGAAAAAAATTQDAPPAASQASGDKPKDASEGSTAPAVTDNKTNVTPSDKTTAPGDDQNGEGSSSSAAVQRRKRFSIKPKVAPGRPSTLTRTPKSPVKAAQVQVPASDPEKPTTSSESGTPAAPGGFRSPRRRRTSEDSKQAELTPKSPLPSSEGLAAPPSDDSGLEETQDVSVDSGKKPETTSESKVKEVSPRIPDKVPPSIPDRESIAISEKARTLMSSKGGLSLSPPAMTLSRLLNDPSDLQRLAKAQKLRALLKQEMHKERRKRRVRTRTKEISLDPAKMTMRDLIRYLPLSNPMSSSLEETVQEDETVLPPSPSRVESAESAQEPEVRPKITTPGNEDEEQQQEEEADEEDQDDEDLMVPQVKVAEDGTLIIDEESLTVEVQRAKGPNLAQERDPIFERGSTTTYSSFRKGTYSKPWFNEETDMFFLAISMVGTDFSMICQLFPHRARSEIKNKFKKEERTNAWRIDKAFRERRKLDIEYFSKLLEKILEFQKNRKKLKSLADKNAPKKQKTTKKKAKAKKAAKTLSDVEEIDEEEEEEEENEIPDLEEGEKENEDLCNEGESPASKPKKKRKRKNAKDASSEEPDEKKNKTGDKSKEQDEAITPEDTEAALPEDLTNSDVPEKTEDVNKAKETTIKPAKLSRGRAVKPLVPLGRKWGKKAPAPSTKSKDSLSDKEGESPNSEEQVDEDALPLNKTYKRRLESDDNSSGGEETAVEPPKPTRYGRVPKRTQPLNYAAKEDANSSASETTPASPSGSNASKPKPSAKRGRTPKPQSTKESKKPKLVTLRASQSDDSDEEEGEEVEVEEVQEVVEEEEGGCSSSKDSVAPAFVPVSLRSPNLMISEVEETMEELDILANMPDVLGISQDALCPDSSFELPHNDSGTAEPCEHQLDLLVDVIDFLSAEHTDAADESYNEAAQTLLTIGNLAHIPQSTQIDTQDQNTVAGTASSSGNEAGQEEGSSSKPAAEEESSGIRNISGTSGHEVEETSEADPTVEKPKDKPDDVDLLTSPRSPKTSSPQTRRGRLSRVKPKPNLSQTSRAAQAKPKPETSAGTESLKSSPDLHPPVVKESEVSCVEEVATQEPSVSESQSVSETSLDQGTTNLKSDTGATESGHVVEQGPDLDSTLVQETTDDPHPGVSIAKEVAEKVDASSPQTRRSRFQKAKPNLARASRTKPQTTQDPEVHEKTVSEVEEKPSTSIDVTSPGPDQGPTVDSAPPGPSTKEIPVGQKEEKEGGAFSPKTSRSRFQKPKPNLARMSRTKAQTTKEVAGKDQDPTPTPQTVKEVEEEPSTSNEKPNEMTCPAPDHGPATVSGSSATPIEDQSSAEEIKMDVGLVGSGLEDPTPGSESTDGKLSPRTGTTDSAIPESQVEQGANVDSTPVQETRDHPAPSVEEFPVSLKVGKDNGSSSQTRRSRFQKAKPNLTGTSRTKAQTTKEAAEKDQDPTPNLESQEEAKPEPISTTSPETTSPDSGSSVMPTEEPTSTEEKKMGGGLPESGAVTSDQITSENLQQPQVQQESTVDPVPSSYCKPIEEPSSSEEQVVDSSPEVPQQSVPQPRRRVSRVKPKPNLGSTTRTAQREPKSKDLVQAQEPQDQKPVDNIGQTQPEEDRTAITDDKVSEDCRTEKGLVKPSTIQSTPDLQGSSDAQSQEVQQSPETTETPPRTTQRPLEDESKSTDSPKSSQKAPPTRRGRLVKPKPNLGRSQTQQKQTTKPAEPDTGSLSQTPGTGLRSEVQEPKEVVPDRSGLQDPAPVDPGSSLTQVPDFSSQDTSTLSQGGTESDPSLTIFPSMLSDQVPSDPDEPFFILSLTEIPVCSSGPDPPDPAPYVPVSDASMNLSTAGDLPLTNVAVNVAMETRNDPGVVSDKDIAPEPVASVSSIAEQPLDPQGTEQPSPLPESVKTNDETEIPTTKQKPIGTRRRAVKPNTQRGRKASTKTPDVVEAESVSMETDTTQVSELPGSSAPRPKPLDEVEEVSEDHAQMETETLKDPEGSNSEEEQKTRATRSRNRKPKENLSEATNPPPSSDPPPGKGKKPQRAGRKQFTLEPVATSSPARVVAPSTSLKTTEASSKSTTQDQVEVDQTSERLEPTPSTSQTTAEVPSSLSSDLLESSTMEEPTSVSQYFLSDIFTEVDDG